MERVKRETQYKKGSRMPLRFVDRGRGLERNREVERQTKKPSDRCSDRERDMNLERK